MAVDFSLPQTFAAVAPHVVPLAHVPQLATVRVAPQLSSAVTAPHVATLRVQNAASVSAVHPHTLTVPLPPHVCDPLHEPHDNVPPQASATLPQFLPS
jgi:hypothetical protein